MPGFIKKIFIGFLTSIVTASSDTKCVSLSNEKCGTQPTFINLHPNEYTQGLRYYPFALNLDRCVRSCNILKDLPSKSCVPNETKNLNLGIFNVTKGIHKSKALKKHISCQLNVNLMEENVIQIKSGITINVHVSVKIWKNMCAKKIFRILLHVVAKMISI